MSAETWIEKIYFLSVDKVTILLPYHSELVYMIPLPVFLGFFKTVIEEALDQGRDPRQAIVESDPDNLLGFNALL